MFSLQTDVFNLKFLMFCLKVSQFLFQILYDISLNLKTLTMFWTTCTVVPMWGGTHYTDESYLQGLVLKPKLDFGKNLCFLVRTMWNYGFWVDVHKSTGTHRNFIIFRCVCNTWTITTRKIYFRWKSSCFQVLSMVLPIIKRTRSISCRFYSIQRYT